MREHIGLFRGKRIDNGEWVYGYYIPALEEGRHCIYPQTSPDMGCYVDPDTIGECTGLKDKNGKLIFEGDIVNCYTFEFMNDFRSLPVNWSELFSGWRAGECKSLYGVSVDIYEIIGNIHDNPELLKGGEG